MFQTSSASVRCGVTVSPHTRVISSVLTVAPSTKWVYHCHIQLHGLSGVIACIRRMPLA
ncbi:hypothetical protein AB4059_02225 [Lysobacter sp. 2RAF19]